MPLRLLSVIALAAALAAQVAFAGARIFEETARITVPDARYGGVDAVAVDGDRIVLSGERWDPSSGITHRAR